MSDVACATASTCFAVGAAIPTPSASGLDRTLIERWNGSRWSIVPSPNPAGSIANDLSAVSCSDASNCFAVGQTETPSADQTFVALTERWNGQNWSIVPSPNPPGAQGGLSDVSCASATQCLAVGSLVEEWDGTAWSVVGSPFGLPIAGVTCLTATSCWGVGGGSGGTAVVAHWDGALWTGVPSPSPTGSSILFRVSCSDASSCFAVGRNENEFGQYSPLIEHWDGSSWSISPSPSVPTYLTDVACASASDCQAVGGFNPQSSPVTEHWDGTAWSLLPPPTGASQSRLAQISCATTTDCHAVGSTVIGGTRVTLDQHWNGKRWSVVTTPNPVGATESSLYGVSCASSTSCVAVGSASTPDQETLVEQWNGSSWSIVPSPSPGNDGNTLAAVTCLTATNCFAVGHYGIFPNPAGLSVRESLVEHWDGASWFAMPVPNLDPVSSELNSIACSSATDCYAVGETLQGDTLVDHWDGTSWSVVTTPNPAAATNSRLSDVKCPSATACYAVGSATIGATTQSLVERWDGSSWTILDSANPSGAALSRLNGLACASTTDCEAVGDYQASFVGYTLAEHWDGTAWSTVATGNPQGALDSVLLGVSCAAPTNCISVGTFESLDSHFTLVERER